MYTYIQLYCFPIPIYLYTYVHTYLYTYRAYFDFPPTLWFPPSLKHVRFGLLPKPRSCIGVLTVAFRIRSVRPTRKHGSFGARRARCPVPVLCATHSEIWQHRCPPCPVFGARCATLVPNLGAQPWCPTLAFTVFPYPYTYIPLYLYTY